MLDSIQCEARLVGRRILELMKPDENGRYFSVFDKAKNEYRRVEYRDVVILLRTTRNWAEVFVDELSVMGIPVFADTGTGFFKTVEVQVMLSLLQIMTILCRTFLCFRCCVRRLSALPPMSLRN